jgi:hypothetical protein
MASAVVSRRRNSSCLRAWQSIPPESSFMLKLHWKAIANRTWQR